MKALVHRRTALLVLLALLTVAGPVAGRGLAESSPPLPITAMQDIPSDARTVCPSGCDDTSIEVAIAAYAHTTMPMLIAQEAGYFATEGDVAAQRGGDRPTSGPVHRGHPDRGAP